MDSRIIPERQAGDGQASARQQAQNSGGLPANYYSNASRSSNDTAVSSNNSSVGTSGSGDNDNRVISGRAAGDGQANARNQANQPGGANNKEANWWDRNFNSQEVQKQKDLSAAQQKYFDTEKAARESKENGYLNKAFGAKEAKDGSGKNASSAENKLYDLPKRCAKVSGIPGGSKAKKEDIADICAQAAMEHATAAGKACSEDGKNSTYKGWKAADDAKKVKKELKDRKGDCYEVSHDATQALKEALANAEKETEHTKKACAEHKDAFNGGKENGEIKALCNGLKKRSADADMKEQKAKIADLTKKK